MGTLFQEGLFTLTLIICGPQSQQCFRSEPEMATMEECEVARTSLIKLLGHRDPQEVFISECMEIDFE